MAEDLSKYGMLRGWEWWEPKPRRRRPYTPSAEAQSAAAAAAGYSTVEEWAAAGWPRPLDPETGKPYEGWKIARIEAGLHPTGRKVTPEDWLDPKTQHLFDYLTVRARYDPSLYGNPLWDWAEQMRVKYPDYPMPGVNMNELLRRLFPDWYEEEEPVVPEARGRVPGLAAPMPTEEPPPPEALRTIPQLAGTSESDQYRQALREMEAWVAGEKVGDWTPLMETWFGRDTPAGNFWQYYWESIPPGQIADDLRKDPIIEMLLNKAFRTVYDVKAGVYEQALETLRAWREAHPEVPGDPQEWAVVRQITTKYWKLKEAGATNEAKALWRYFAAVLEPYYPSARRAVTPRPRPAPRRRRGRPKGGLQAWRNWRRWPRIRYYARR